jgi:hypothetical protein
MNLIFDDKGNVYCTTTTGGVAFELTPQNTNGFETAAGRGKEAGHRRKAVAVRQFTKTADYTPSKSRSGNLFGINEL